jgi:hypothetical protein
MPVYFASSITTAFASETIEFLVERRDVFAPLWGALSKTTFYERGFLLNASDTICEEHSSFLFLKTRFWKRMSSNISIVRKA